MCDHRFLCQALNTKQVISQKYWKLDVQEASILKSLKDWVYFQLTFSKQRVSIGCLDMQENYVFHLIYINVFNSCSNF